MSKLSRISIGGLEEIPDFSGNVKDYAALSYVTFTANTVDSRIKMVGQGKREYPTGNGHVLEERGEFLREVNSILEENDWYLPWSEASKTFWSNNQRVHGYLFSRKTNTSTPLQAESE
jgi:hypothetical protein